jgi:KUP system potassium uptake protein
MKLGNPKKSVNNLTAAGLIVTLGIIYGDIGTSPLYVMKAIVGDENIDRALVLGGLSCIVWTLTVQTTIKYVWLTLKADNRGEGGIFSLYALVRRRSPYLVWPAIIGGSALLADGIITPPISVSSAIEGLRLIHPHLPTVPIVIAILIVLFVIQRFGTKLVGNTFGPLMLVWFVMLGALGLVQMNGNWDVLRCLDPSYAFNLLVKYPGGFWLLGAVFLCTTGAEALYSDLGHCGRQNIRISWIFVKVCLILNYLGQGAWILQHEGGTLNGLNPFYELMPIWFLPYGIGIATIAAIIASQALISGSFTLISEAMRLNLWPKAKVNFPTLQKGQLFVPSINWLMLAGCIFVVLHFRESSHMEAAYGLAISLTMMMTTILLCFYLSFIKKIPTFYVILVFIAYMVIEGSFLIANLSKFMHGGYVTLLISGILIAIMFVWHEARKIKNRLTEFVRVEEYYHLLQELSGDMSIPKYATHLVYLTSANNPREIESKIIYSIFNKQPKRADIYWFVHIDVTDDPHTMEYEVEIMLPNDLVRVDFRLGFRVEQRINLFFRKVVEDLVQNHEVDFTSRYTSLKQRNVIGDFRFIVLEKHLSHDNDLPADEQLIMDAYFALHSISLSEASAFGLDTSSVTIEKVPLVITPMEGFELKRRNRPKES